MNENAKNVEWREGQEGGAEHKITVGHRSNTDQFVPSAEQELTCTAT